MRALIKTVIGFVVLATLGGCGGGGSPFTQGSSGGTGTTGGTTTASSVTLLASSPQLNSDASTSTNGVTLTAIVRASNNSVLQGQTVSFSASSGAIQVTQAQTDASGAATAILTTGGNPENRTIPVPAPWRSLKPARTPRP
jgi:hypothetical protein